MKLYTKFFVNTLDPHIFCQFPQKVVAPSRHNRHSPFRSILQLETYQHVKTKKNVIPSRGSQFRHTSTASQQQIGSIAKYHTAPCRGVSTTSPFVSFLFYCGVVVVGRAWTHSVIESSVAERNKFLVETQQRGRPYISLCISGDFISIQWSCGRSLFQHCWPLFLAVALLELLFVVPLIVVVAVANFRFDSIRLMMRSDGPAAAATWAFTTEEGQYKIKQRVLDYSSRGSFSSWNQVWPLTSSLCRLVCAGIVKLLFALKAHTLETMVT